MKYPPALRYFGGKHQSADLIVAQFPPHQCYVEPYGGGASILLSKYPSKIEVYNDASGEMVNFFQCLRDRVEELVRAIRLTPYSRLEWKKAFEYIDYNKNPIENARRLYVRSWQSFSPDAIGYNDTGWRFLYQTTGGEDVVGCFNRTDHLWVLSERMKKVQIECDDAITVIKRYGRNPEAVIYCDPPYVASTRSGKGNYLYEMDDSQHRELSEVLHSVDAAVIVSGYDCELYRELYKEWKLIDWNARINGGKGGKRKAVECLWLSPKCTTEQMPLFNAINYTV